MLGFFQEVQFFMMKEEEREKREEEKTRRNWLKWISRQHQRDSFGPDLVRSCEYVLNRTGAKTEGERVKIYEEELARLKAVQSFGAENVSQVPAIHSFAQAGNSQG